MLRFAAFNQRATPEVHGRVTLIGGDQTADEKTGRPYFKLQVRPDASELAHLGNVKFVAGMPVEAFVQIMCAFRKK